jgi:TPR repeat protein
MRARTIAGWVLAALIAMVALPVIAQQDEGPILLPKKPVTNQKPKPAVAQTIDNAEAAKRGFALYEAKQYAMAAPLLQQACGGGEARACLDLGEIYRPVGLRKQGIVFDGNKAVVLFRKACDKGNDIGCSRLAEMYGSNWGKESLPERAVFYANICDRGIAEGCYMEAFSYLVGNGVAKDVGKAQEVYGRAAALRAKACDGGDTNECFNLAYQYHWGQGVPQDDGKMVALLGKACDGGNLTACVNLGGCYIPGQNCAVEKDIQKAANLLERACDGGEALGCFGVGTLYKGESGFPVDLEKARGFFSRACSMGAEDVCTELPQSLPSGISTWTDPSTGLMWTSEGRSGLNWHQAADYCQGLLLAGLKDWRLPTIEELAEIYDWNSNVPYYWKDEQGAGNYLVSHTKGKIHIGSPAWSCTPNKVTSVNGTLDLSQLGKYKVLPFQSEPDSVRNATDLTDQSWAFPPNNILISALCIRDAKSDRSPKRSGHPATQ